METSTARRGLAVDLALAAALALVLSLVWTLNDWPRLSRMLLPDNDDMVRLAQVRDWLAGQPLNDWTQYRMTPPLGAPMHWSRVNDAGIAGLILAATPLLGRAQAELFAVIAYPALLFACALFLSARIGRRLWGTEAGPVAAVLTALAYPGTTVFIPGRIDHHALQVVLLQLIVLLLMQAPRLRGGVLTGALVAITLVVGLETAPQIVALVGCLVLLWVDRGKAERARLAGFAAGITAVTLLFFLFLRPTYWNAALCDGFTPASVAAAVALGLALGALAVATPHLGTWRLRLTAGAVLGACAVAAVLLAFPACLQGPYGAMHPFLRTAFMPYINEANSVFAQPRIARVIATGGLVATATIVSAWMLVRERARWQLVLPLAAAIGISGVVMLFQMRGAYVGAPLVAPMLAVLVVMARRRSRHRLPAVVGAWIAGAGMAYVAIPEQIETLAAPAADEAGSHANTPRLACTGGDAWRLLDGFPPGRVMAGSNVAAYLIGATHHATVGAGYHRNDAGNMAVYRFFLSAPEQARAIGRAWQVDYVAFCPDDFGEIDVTRRYPASLAARLERDDPPSWLRPLPLHGEALRFYRVVP